MAATATHTSPGSGESDSPMSDLSFLIGDTGQPGFPGWEAITGLLMAATIAALASGDLQTVRLRRHSERALPRAPIAASAAPVRALTVRLA